MNLKRFRYLGLLIGLAILGTLALRSRAQAQDASILKPPKGAKVALIVFEDLECPDCARANPLLEEAARTYKIPLVRYDFPLPQHIWSREAAILARYFDTRSGKLGDEFRDSVFKHQSEITSKESLRAFADKFAAEHNVVLPFAVDPQGKLSAAVQADRALGERVGLSHTPTIYVVSDSRTGQPFVEVVDRRQLYQMIDAMKAEAK
jgi:protein-disulfide isomerase